MKRKRILKYQSRNEIAKEIEKPNRYNKTRNVNKEDSSKPSPKKDFFTNKKNQTSRARSYTYKSNLNAKTVSCSEASSSEEEDIGIRKSRRKSDFENKNKELNGSGIEEEEIKSSKWGRKGSVETKNEKTKEINSEEEDIGIQKCRRKSRIDKIDEEVKRWTSSSKQQEYTPERTKTKEETRLERTKIKLKKSALELDDLMLQAQLKSLM